MARTLLLCGCAGLFVIPGTVFGESGANTPTFRVPILMYHYIDTLPKRTSPSERDLTVTPATFSKQLDWLQSHGYHTIPFVMLSEPSILPKNPVVLTFDDGYEDAYANAFPALQSHGMVGTFFIITGDVGKSKYVTWDQIKAMDGAGMEIGAHTVTHPNLKSLDAKKQSEEILGSITELQKNLGMTIKSFAYPLGKYNTTSLGIVRKSGIPFAVTTHHGIAQSGQNPFTLPRLRVKEKTKFEELLK